MPLPPVCSMVSVYATTLPHLSADRQMRGVLALVRRRRGRAAGSRTAAGSRGSPGASGLVSTASSLMRHSRESAYLCESSSFVGTSSKAGSPTQRPRSANAIRLASM